MNSQPILWVVEMLCNKRWEPTCGVKISRADARAELLDWRHDNPCDKFRLRPYVARPPLRRGG